MTRAPAILALCAALALAACGGDDDEQDAATTAAQTDAAETATETGADEGQGSGAGGGQGAGGGGGQASKPAQKPGITITTADSQFGEILFDGDQRAIYLFDKEDGPRSECYGDCAAAWPPVLTKGEPQAGGAAQSKLLGTTKRDDGTTQVTYDGKPLYFYVDDPPGQVLCHNVDEFGGLWLVLEPNGDAVG